MAQPGPPPVDSGAPSVTEVEKEVPPEPGYPPYPPYQLKPTPPSVADTIKIGKDLRMSHKSQQKQQVHPPPTPARPRGAPAGTPKMKRRKLRDHIRCLKKHNVVLSDRLEYMAKPRRRTVIFLWREQGSHMSPAMIARLRTMLDADKPLKPDQAYEYFISQQKAKKARAKKMKVNQVKKDMQSSVTDKKFSWARNATVVFARGIQQRLSRPGSIHLADGMLRLSNIILGEICTHMHMRKPSRQSTNPKARFMMDVSDKVAVWIDEILEEADDKMLMMDFDEDDDLLAAERGEGFTDDFLSMMGGGGLLQGLKPAYMKFSGEMLEAFIILTDAMTKKGKEELLKHGKFTQTYKEGADELKSAPSFDPDGYNSTLANKLNIDLAATAQPTTPANIAPYMKEMVDICSKYLSKNAEDNKEKGPAFRLLVKTMKTRSNDPLYEKGKVRKTFGKGATHLEKAKGLETDHDDPNLSQEIHSALAKSVDTVTTPDLKADMAETLDVCSKYLSQQATDENERGPAFDFLIKELEKYGSDPFTPEHSVVGTNYVTAYALKSAPGLTVPNPDSATAPKFHGALNRVVADITPANLKSDMPEVVDRCGNYLSSYIRDRDKVMQILLKQLKGNSGKALVQRNNYTMNYGVAATETETAPVLVPYLPVKDVSNDIKGNLTQEVEPVTPAELKVPMKSLVGDVSQHLSQFVAMRSGIGGPRYNLNYLAAAKHTLADRPLFKYKALGQTYSDGAEVLNNAGPLERDPKAEELRNHIASELKRGMPLRVGPTVMADIQGTMDDAAAHLAKVGTEKGNALTYLVDLMKEKGKDPLANLQGTPQSYAEGAKRIEASDTLTADKVDKATYDQVKPKLNSLVQNKPNEHEKHLPGIIDDASKYLSQPLDSMGGGRGGRGGGGGWGFGPDGKPLGPDGKPLRLGPDGRPIGPDGRPLGPDGKPLGPDGKPLILGPDGKPLILGPDGKPLILGPDGKPLILGPDGKPLILGPDGKPLRLGPDGRPLGPDGKPIILGPDGKPLRLGPDGRPIGPDGRPLGPDGRPLGAGARGEGLYGRGGMSDVEHEAALKILHAQLKAHGGEVLYSQPRTSLSHSQASDWLTKVPPVDKCVKDAGDTNRLSKKLEKKMTTIVEKVTPETMKDSMQDVIIESSRVLSEVFVSQNYKLQVRDALIAEMQKRGNEILINVDGVAETSFFAAQRLKNAQSLEAKQPCAATAYILTKKLEEIIKCRVMPRKLVCSMKEHIKDVADYLSEHVTKPDKAIEAYVNLVNEMEAAGDSQLVKGDIPKTYKEAATYLKLLTSTQDPINRPNSTIQSQIEEELRKIVANATASADDKKAMEGVISPTAKLIVSYVMLQDEKTKTLKALVDIMEKDGGENVLLRHGNVRKTYLEGVERLRNKNAAQLSVPGADPVVVRKIQIKLNNLVSQRPPDKTQTLMDDVIEETTMYLAVGLLQPQYRQVCKCMKNVFVQCELWCDEILRKVARPCCSCARHLSKQALSDIAPAQSMTTSPSSMKVFAPGIQISLQQCPARPSRSKTRPEGPCPSTNPACNTTSYLMYSTSPDRNPYRESNSSSTESPMLTGSPSDSPKSSSVHKTITDQQLIRDIYARTDDQANLDYNLDSISSELTPSNSPTKMSDSSNAIVLSERESHWQSILAMMATTQLSNSPTSSRLSTVTKRLDITRKNWEIVSTDQMSDWQAMLVSLVWNVHAWRDWIQECIDQAHGSSRCPGLPREKWYAFKQRTSIEALQWRQYNKFTKELMDRLSVKYKDKTIVSPTRATDRTHEFKQNQRGINNIVNMFDRWTRWLSAVIKETDTMVPVADVDIPINELKWCHFRVLVDELIGDWNNYNVYLQSCLEHKYGHITGCMPTWNEPGPVWVMSAFGAVPSGAMVAGVNEGEVLWVARTTHRCNVIPAALQPSKHYCLVYANGRVNYYTKYQVLCNADVSWVSCSSSHVPLHGVEAATGVYIGRVLYRGGHLVGPVRVPSCRCHVNILGKPFSFNNYELLVHSSREPE